MTNRWKVHACSLATTLVVAYMGCAVFDLLFPPYGMLAALSPHSPWPLSGSVLGLLAGLVTFGVAGLVIGALYGLAWEFWDKRLASSSL